MRPPRRRITVGLAGLGLLVQLGELHHPLHGGHQVLHLGRLSDAVLQHPGEHDAVGDGEADVPAHNVSSEQEEAEDDDPNIDGDQPVQPDGKPPGGREEGEPGGGVQVLLVVELGPHQENTWRLPGISQLG